MLNSIKRYELSDNLTVAQLKEVGFKQGGWIPGIDEPKMNYARVLIDDIELHIEVSVIDGKVSNFDDYNNIYIFDDNYGQVYTPFYNSTSNFPYLDRVISRYNEEMDKLFTKGILKSINSKEKTKVKLLGK